MGYERQAEKRDLVLTRIFDVPVERVWRAWSDPDYVMQWWGPTGFTSPLASMDFRVGGTSLVCMRAPDGQDFYSTWHYRAIVPLQRIEYIHNLADATGYKIDPATVGMPPDFPQDQLHSVTFQALSDQQTEMSVTEYGWTVGQMLDMSRLGLEQCLDKMAVLLARD